MWEKIKKFLMHAFVFTINIGLIASAAAYMKKQQDKKNAEKAQLVDEQAIQEAAQISAKAQELDSIIQKNATQKTESIANNPAEVIVQQPKTVTQVVPGGTTTVKSTAPSTKSSSSKTTKNS